MEKYPGKWSTQARPAGIPHLPREIERLIMSYARIGDIFEVSPIQQRLDHTVLQVTASASLHYNLLTPVGCKRAQLALPGTPSLIFKELDPYGCLAAMYFPERPLWEDHYILFVSPSLAMWRVEQFLEGIALEDVCRIHRIAFNDLFITEFFREIFCCISRFVNLEELILVSEVFPNQRDSGRQSPEMRIHTPPRATIPLASDTFEFVYPPLVWPGARDRSIITPWERCQEVEREIRDAKAVWGKEPTCFQRDIKVEFVWIRRNGVRCPSDYVEPPAEQILIPEPDAKIDREDEEFIYADLENWSEEEDGF